jgi:hypothetical protein
MTTDRIGMSFDGIPKVTIDGQKIDVAKAAKSGKGVSIAKGNALLVATKKRGGGYRIEIRGDPKVLSKWKFKVRNARIDRVGDLDYREINAKAKKISGRFQLDQKFLVNYRKQITSRLGDSVRKSGLKGFKDKDIETLRRHNRFSKQFMNWLRNPKVPVKHREAALREALQGPDPNAKQRLPQQGDQWGMPPLQPQGPIIHVKGFDQPKDPDEVARKLEDADLKCDPDALERVLERGPIAGANWNRMVDPTLDVQERQKELDDYLRE